ncbi:hypothetical protein ACFL34_01445 [Candidatus Sumerlaeota bacterium]
MTRKHLGILVALVTAVILVFAAIATRSGLDTSTPEPFATTGDPLAVPLLVHMLDGGELNAGPEPGAELVVTRRDDRIHVQVSKQLLDRLGPGALEKLGLLTTEQTMSWSRYNRFLESLHDSIVEMLDEHEHEHDS